MAYARNLDNWDPMTENYHDANVNSYERGPGVNLTPYATTPPNSEHKLYVSSIPPELSETGIWQVLNRYGKTLSLMSPPGSTWAYVTYGSYREAETVIRELNGKEPLNLTITFAKKKENESDRKKPLQLGIPNIEPIPHTVPALDNRRREFISPEHRPVHTRPFVRNMGRGRELAAVARRAIAPLPEHPVYHENDDLLYPAIHDPNIYDPYEEAGPFPDTNNMWARGRFQVSNDGTRFVTMGRGYTWYKLPTPHPRVNQQIRAVYENRAAGLYEYGENKLAQQIGKCQNCVKPATMRCQNCREFYCSRSCQELDWPRHKIECQAMPGLDGGPDSASMSISSGEGVPPQVPINEKRTIHRLRRPLTTSGPLTAPNYTSTPIHGTSQTSEIPAVIPDVNDVEPREKENKLLLSQDKLKRNHSGYQKPAFDRVKAHNAGGWNPMKNGDDSQAPRNHDSQELGASQRLNSSNGLPPQVLKQDNSPKREQSKNSSQGSFDRNLESQNTAESPIETEQTSRNFFKRGNTQQKDYQQVTEQVKKLNVNDPETAKPVHKPDPDFKFYKPSVAPEISHVKSAQKVSFEEQKSDAVVGIARHRVAPKAVVNDINKKVSVPTKNKTIAMNQSAPLTMPRAKRLEKNVVELLHVSEEGCFEAHVLLGGNKAAVTVCVLKFQEEYAKISSELTPKCEKIPKPLSFKPKVGDFVSGRRLDDWIRGTVTSLGPPIRLAAVDEGRVEPVTDLKPVPQEFLNLPTLGAICELTNGDFKLEAMAQYTFMVLNKNSANIASDGIEVVLFSADEKEGRGILKPWTPAPEQRGIPYATLTTGTEVCIVSFRSHTLIFVRSLVQRDLELFKELTQNIARWSTKAKKLTEPPITGEMVIAKYAEDGNFYRAIVRKIDDEKIIVSYVDYGNIETTTLDNILPISPQLKEYASYAARIVLKDVPTDVPITKEVNNYLATLAGKETPLVCTFDGSPATDGVILKSADGTCVNKKIVELLTPSWKKEEDKTTVFMVGDLDVAELGTVGDTVNVLTLFSYGPLMHAMAPQDMELIEHVTSVMAIQMKEYCDQLKENYIPRQSELCLAPYEGLWYRAVCLDPNTTLTTSTVNFIDFGNIEEIPHTDLRLMTKDFMTTKTLASVCQVVGLGPVDAEGDLPPAIEKRVTELVPPNAVTLVKIVKCTQPGEYVVELPDIREILIKEGLLKV